MTVGRVSIVQRKDLRKKRSEKKIYSMIREQLQRIQQKHKLVLQKLIMLWQMGGWRIFFSNSVFFFAVAAA